MVARVKDTGREELASFRRRVLRVAGLGRISKGDADYIVDLIDKVDARVIRMHEKPDDKEQELW